MSKYSDTIKLQFKDTDLTLPIQIVKTFAVFKDICDFKENSSSIGSIDIPLFELSSFEILLDLKLGISPNLFENGKTWKTVFEIIEEASKLADFLGESFDSNRLLVRSKVYEEHRKQLNRIEMGSYEYETGLLSRIPMFEKIEIVQKLKKEYMRKVSTPPEMSKFMNYIIINNLVHKEAI